MPSVMKTIGSGFLSVQGPHRNIKEIDVSVQGAALDYAAAHAIADVLAKKVARATMLVAWFDASRRTFFFHRQATHRVGRHLSPLDFPALSRRRKQTRRR